MKDKTHPESSLNLGKASPVTTSSSGRNENLFSHVRGSEEGSPPGCALRATSNSNPQESRLDYSVVEADAADVLPPL